MNSVQRPRGILRIIRAVAFRKPAPNYVTAGSAACGRMMREARSRKQKSGPSDRAILAWAEFDLAKEIADGFWEIRAA